MNAEQTPMLIDGRWVASDNEFTSVDPSTGEAISNVALADAEHIDQAVQAARRALPAWGRLGPSGRANCMTGLVEALRDAYGNEGERTALKDLLQREVGKRLPEADIEVAESADMLEYFVRSGPALLGPEALALDADLWPTKTSIVQLQSVGVVAVIKPWNYPLELPIWAIAPALIAGNTIVFKPAQDSPLIGAEIARMANDYLPSGVFNVVHGDAAVGRMLVQADIDMVAFTGSTAAGQEIATECARRMRRYTLELGGIDAAIVANDADLELTANGLTWGAFANAGQVCVRPKRVIVDDSVADDLLALLLERTAALRVDLDFGPLINERQLEKVARQVRATVDAGAHLAAGGERLADRPGFYYTPTILDHVTPSMTICVEECFGPVLPLLRVSNLDEAIETANASEFGLGASVWSQDRQRAKQTAEELNCGMVWINDVNVAFPQAPWGGRKMSGSGTELGKWGLYEYVKPKHISSDSDTSERRAWWFPYESD